MEYASRPGTFTDATAGHGASSARHEPVTIIERLDALKLDSSKRADAELGPVAAQRGRVTSVVPGKYCCSTPDILAPARMRASAPAWQSPTPCPNPLPSNTNRARSRRTSNQVLLTVRAPRDAPSTSRSVS